MMRFIRVLLPLTLPLGPYWETYEQTKVWRNALVVKKYSAWYRAYWSLTVTVCT